MIRLTNDPPVQCIIHGTLLGECYLEGQKRSKCEWVYGTPEEIEEDED